MTQRRQRTLIESREHRLIVRNNRQNARRQLMRNEQRNRARSGAFSVLQNRDIDTTMNSNSVNEGLNLFKAQALTSVLLNSEYELHVDFGNISSCSYCSASLFSLEKKTSYICCRKGKGLL